MAIEIKCYCFPTFKDLLAFSRIKSGTYHIPFFKRSAKVRAYQLLSKFFPNIFRSFWRDSQTVLWRTTPCFPGGCKNTMCTGTSKVFSRFLFTSASHSYPDFQELPPFFERAAKIRARALPTKCFYNKKVKSQWNARLARITANTNSWAGKPG